MPKTNNKKIVKYKKRRYLNVGVVIFGATFIYLLVMLILYFTRDRITIYEVVKDSVTVDENLSYTGIIVRDEVVTTADKSGYINFFACDGDRISLNSNIYTISESGELSTTLEDVASSGVELNETTVNTIKDNINQFTVNYNDMNFNSVYSFKFNMEYIVLENFNSSQISSDGLSFEIMKPLNTGTLIYSIDNYESLTESKLNAKDFENSSYTKNILNSGDKVEKGDPIFKTITSETWSLIIPLSEVEADKYKDISRLKIKFLSDNITEIADFKILDLPDGKYGKLTFDNYAIRYANSRYLEIKIIRDKITGLKIPKTSVLEKEFYLIPEEYGIYGNGYMEFLLQSYIDGVPSAKLIQPKIYYYNTIDNKGYYYVSLKDFNVGDVILTEDSSDSYIIGEIKKIQGVYNVNNGYADFQYIDILTRVNDYYIIKEKTGYSPTQYDYIVLNAKKVSENEVVFR